jgi:hypothetical protein
MRVHTYGAGDAEPHTHPDVPPETRLGDLAAIEAGEVAYRVGDGGEVEAHRTLAEIFGEGPGHVIVHHCREITVTVAYGGTERDLDVRPSTKIEDVRAEAIAAFGLDPATAADLVLRLPGSTEDLPSTRPIGIYVPKGSCVLTVDLVHAVRPQG